MSKAKHATITEAQHAVMEQINMLDKDAQAHDFQYTSAAFALLVLRPLMLKHGISKFKVKTEHHGRWQNGIGVDYNLTFRYQLTGATELIPGVTYQDVYVAASGKVGKSGDKSTFASQTTGSKYADVDFFNLPMTDDIETFEEAAELLNEKYNDLPGGDTQTEDGKTEEELEIPESSKGISYADGVLELIEQVFEAGGAKAVVNFTDGDTRNKVEALVEELVGEEPEDEEEDEEEEKPKKSSKKSSKKSKKDDEEDDGDEVSLDEIDYDDEDVIEALFQQVDIEDDEVITNLITNGFTDPEALKAFYTVCVERAGEIGADFQDEFNETHFETLQETFEELVD